MYIVYFYDHLWHLDNVVLYVRCSESKDTTVHKACIWDQLSGLISKVVLKLKVVK